MSETMTADQVWDAFLGEGRGAIFRVALMGLLTIPIKQFDEAIERIHRETLLGPLINPTAYVDGRRFKNADDYIEVLQAARKLRATLEKLRPEEIGGGE